MTSIAIGDRYRILQAAERLAGLVADKNEAYGNSVQASADIMRILYPNGVTPDQYIDVLLIVRVLDKLKRISTDRDALGESPWHDIAGYGILGYLAHGDDQPF